LQSSPADYPEDFLIPQFVAPLIAALFPDRLLKALLFSSALVIPAIAAGEARLESDMDVATAGYFQLRWVADSSIELQESRSADFASPRTVYTGPDAARVLSGKPDGGWYYRVGVRNGDVSNTVKVIVRHHSLERALAFFAVGLTVFLATLLMIVRGARESIRARTGT
jgi:hypothetical protein